MKFFKSVKIAILIIYVSFVIKKNKVQIDSDLTKSIIIKKIPMKFL